jgi:hypothetical protein
VGRSPKNKIQLKEKEGKDMTTVKEAIAAIKLAEASLRPASAPRWDKAEIEQAREKASEGLLFAIQLLERQGK